MCAVAVYQKLSNVVQSMFVETIQLAKVDTFLRHSVLHCYVVGSNIMFYMI